MTPETYAIYIMIKEVVEIMMKKHLEEFHKEEMERDLDKEVFNAGKRMG